VAPIVSVVIATRNRCRMLPGAIQSVLAQTLPDVEVVVVDDGSEDDTPKVCTMLANGDPRVVVLRITHSGRSAARNYGLARARGAWLSFLDDDDLLVPSFVEKMLRLASASATPCACEAWLFDDASAGSVAPLDLLAAPERHGLRPVHKSALGGTATMADLIAASILPLNTVLAPTDLVRALGGFRKGLEHCEDYDLWLRLMAHTGPWPLLHERLAFIRCHPSQTTHEIGKMARAAAEIIAATLQAHPELIAAVGRSRLRRRIAFLHREAAYAALLAGDGVSARRSALASLRSWGLDPKAWAYLLLSPRSDLYYKVRSRLRRGS